MADRQPIESVIADALQEARLTPIQPIPPTIWSRLPKWGIRAPVYVILWSLAVYLLFSVLNFPK